VHIHALVLDGVFARDGAGEIAFHPARGLRRWTWPRFWQLWSPGSGGVSMGRTPRR
jgi:hypothetical protein